MQLQKVRREMEDATVHHESQLEQLRKKHNDGVVELNEQLDIVQKTRAKYVVHAALGRSDAYDC